MSDVLTLVVVIIFGGIGVAAILTPDAWWPNLRRTRKSSLSYQPRGDRVIVKRSLAPEPQAGDVLMPASQQKPMNSGVVVAVGPGCRNPVTGTIDAIEDLKPDDRVEFLDYAGSDVEIDGESYLCMRESEIHGKRNS